MALRRGVWLRVVVVVIVLSVGGLMAGLPASGYTQGSTSPCVVSANYVEAANENRRTLIWLLARVYADQSPLDDPEITRIHYMMLASTRYYHEDIHTTLPDCARELNVVLIGSIAATQDVLALVLAQRAAPGRAADLHHQRMLDNLTEQWQVLARVWQETALTGGA